MAVPQPTIKFDRLIREEGLYGNPSNLFQKEYVISYARGRGYPQAGNRPFARIIQLGSGSPIQVGVGGL